MRFLLLLAALSPPAAAGPTLVTATEGPVSVDGQPAPAVPFVLDETAALVLGDEASVVLLSAGNALRVAAAGPVDLSALAATPSAQAAAVDGLISHRVDTSRVGATRSLPGTVPAHLRRPLSGAPVLALSTLSWTCSAPCPSGVAELVPAATDEAALACTESPCELPPGLLSPGPWVVRLDGQPLGAFRVPEAEERARLAALVAAGDEVAASLPAQDLQGRASVRAAVRWQAGLPSDALAVLDAALAAEPSAADRAVLEALLAAYEARAGLAP